VTHIDPATPAVDPVELIARYLDDVALDAVANRAGPTATQLRAAATELLDDLLAGDEPEPAPAPPIVERDTDAVRIVEHILATHTHPRPIADAIVEALFGIPTVTRHDDGRVTVDWQDTPTHRPRACIVARDLLDDIAELLERAAGAEHPCRRLHLVPSERRIELTHPDDRVEAWNPADLTTTE